MKPFIPDLLPLKNLDWKANIALVGRANRAISRYDGLLQGIPDPNIMLAPLTAQEAVLSSKIEGTRATLADILQHDAGHSPKEASTRADIEEISNYRTALQFARNALDDGRKFSLSLLKELHQVLLASGRGKNKNPGKFRTTQNWIGAPGSTMKEAAFVPPEPHVIQDYLDNFERYYHVDESDPDESDPLVQLSILHAQFEIIHPFDDGNGRLGRMLIPLFLYEKKILSAPMFYLSSYLEENRSEYVERLRRIGQEPAAWNDWVRFFMRAIIEQSEVNNKKINKIKNLYDGLKFEIPDLINSKSAVSILDYMFSVPIFSPADLATLPNMPTRAQLGRFFKILKDSGIVTVLTEGRGRQREVLCFPALVNLCEDRLVFSDPRSPWIS